MTRADEAGRQLANSRLVADERDALTLRMLLEIRQHRRDASPGSQRFGRHEVRMGVQTAGEDLGGLPRAHERARDNHVEHNVEPFQRARELAQLRHPVSGQRALRVVGPRVTPLFGLAMTNEINLAHTASRKLTVSF